jgi:hypothetical protein
MSVLLLLAALAAIPASTGTAAPHRLASTSVVHLRPVNGHGQFRPGYFVKKTLKHGSCSAGSEATGDAYRCFAGNAVVDPCWVEHSRDFVACLTAPWSFKVIQIHVSKGYQNAGYTKKPARLPWGVQVTDGRQCVLAQGASGTVGGKRINYFCTNATYVLYGNVNRTAEVWTIHKATPASGGTFTKAGRVGLAKAWFGKPSHKG